MLLKLLYPVLALVALLGVWLGIHTLARRTAERHPEYGPFRESGGGCGGGKGCGSCGAPAEQRCDR